MLASQLLRILQSIPNDEKHENGVIDPAEQDMTVKENGNTALCDEKNLGVEADPLALGNKEVYQLNASERDSSTLALEAKDGEVHHWNPFLDDFSMDNENGTRDSPRKEQLNGASYEVGGQEKDTDPLSSDRDDESKLPEHELSMILEEFTEGNEKERIGSSLPHVAASDLHETDMDLYTDKNVLECELPELIVCYKDINHHIVKDISIDEGMPVKDKISVESSQDDQSDRYSLQPPNDNDNIEAPAGGVDMDFFISNGLAASLSEKREGTRKDECRNKEENSGDVIVEEKTRLPLDISFKKDIAKHCDPVESVQQTGEANSNATDSTVNNASKEDSFIDRRLPIQKFGTRSFLRSFMSSLDFEENKVAELLEQIPSGQAVSGSLAEAVPKEDVQNRSLLYNSEMENGSITFNFNSPAPAVVGIKTGSTEDVQEQSIDSRDVHDQSTRNEESNIGTPHERSLNSEDENSNGFSSTSQVQRIRSNDKDNNGVHEQFPVHKNDNSNEFSAYISKTDSPSSINNDGQAIKHERRNSNNASVVSNSLDDVGESSFSAMGGLITYSEPIPPSANISLRSDGSTTSGRSFGFPVLQQEWGSSPVRMGKADGKHFRKHKSWRSGLFCCRF